MSQWGQGQPGFQYPMQTGFPAGNPQFQQTPQFQQQQQNPQFQQGFGAGPGGLVAQPTGFPGQQRVGLQPQQTGFPGAPGYMMQQPTGFPAMQQQRAPPPPVPPIPNQFQQQNQSSSYLGVGQPQQGSVNRLLSPSPSMGGPGLATHPTGFGARPLVPQMTGFVDPRLQMMSGVFMPTLGAGGAPTLPPQQLQGGMNLQQSIQQHNQELGAVAPRIPWALSKSEKKEYDRIFRAWDTSGSGFINGQNALEVFGQSGLPKDDLARIWGLADVDDRGKLNLGEFHVAMGLIYRRLNGNPIPDQLPPELIPPSARDLEGSVNFIKDLLRDETRSRSPSSIDTPVSRLKDRSFNSSSSSLHSGRDATIYKYNDSEPAGGFYQPRSRHVNRDDVRTRDDDSPASDLTDMKRQLQNIQKSLDSAAEADANRTAEDDALDREMSDLRYRIRKVQDDIEYVSRGPRNASKDEERRRLERDLLDLMHNRVPEVEKKIQAREERREREKREWRHQRDRANERSGRFDYKEERDSYSSRRYEDDRETNRSRGAYDYDRDRDRDRDRNYDHGSYRRDSPADRYGARDRDRERERDTDRSREKTPPSARSPPPASPSASAPVAPTPTTTRAPPSPAPTKNMTQAERVAHARAQAQRRIQERMQALGISSPSTTSSPTVDTTVEERLALERKEAEEKARVAEEEAAERAKSRQERLDNEKALKGGKVTPAPASPTPTPTPTSTAAPPQATPAPKMPPPSIKPRAPAPPPPRKTTAKPPAPPVAPPAPKPVVIAPPVPPAEPEVDPEEEALRAREEAIRKQREARNERLRQLEREEEEARLEEERFKARIAAAKAASSPTIVTPPVSAAPPPAPPAPPAPVPSVVSPPSNPSSANGSVPHTAGEKSSMNPFNRFMKEGGGTPSTLPPTGTSSTNPFFRPQTAPPPSVPTPPKTPTPVTVKTSYHTAPGDSDNEDWDAIKEYDDGDDSSDDEITRSRNTRVQIAESLFGSGGGGIPRPPSAPAASVSAPRVPTPSQAQVPVAPPAPPPPAPPVAPPAPAPPPAVSSSISGPGDVSALMQSIQGGARLRSVKTVDKSGPQVSGRVLGDDAPPAHINAAPRPVSPPRPPSPPQTFPETPSMAPAVGEESTSRNLNHRQSVDWYAGLAADHGHVVDRLPSTTEEDEDTPSQEPAPIPQIFVEHPADAPPDPLADIDKTVEHRVRTLYLYAGESADDLSFEENIILLANPSKTGGDWWFGTSVKDGKSGLFPKTYVQTVNPIQAKALYAYEATNSDELSFAADDKLSVVDTIEPEWWKVESRGQVFVVPASYLELMEGSASGSSRLSSVQDKVPASLQEARDVGRTLEDPTTAAETDHFNSDSDASDDDDEYYSASDGSDSDANTYESAEDLEAREHERQLVLEAAGLILKKDVEPPPQMLRRRSTRRHRPPPAMPRRTTSVSSHKELPDTPQVELETNGDIRLEDAFDRYEHFRQSRGGMNANRLSIASSSSVDAPILASPETSMSTNVSREGENRTFSYLLPFLGGKKSLSESERPTISAPILQTPSDSPTRSTSPAFGSSWASLIDRTALEGLLDTERKRQEAIFEFITTEAAYVRDLQLIVEVFYSSMLPLLETKAITVVFANVEDILLTNTSFLSELEQRQKECRLYIDKIGDILQTHIVNMGVYMEYCVNQATAIQVLQSLRESNPELAAHLQRLRDDPSVRNLDLSSYLLVPMQRITRYPLLIRQILHYTELTDEKKQINRALDVSEKILSQINEAIRYQEGRETLKKISQNLWIGQGRLDLTAPTRYMGERRLLKEGMLSKAKSRRKLQTFLCNDVLVLTDEGVKSLYRMPIPLSEVQVKEPTNKDEVTFQVALAYPRGGETIGLKAASSRECQEWIQAIHWASRRSRDAEKKASKRR